MKYLKILFLFQAFIFCFACNPKISGSLNYKDLGKDVSLLTSYGTIIIRLSDSTPLHRDNFLRLVKKGFYDSLLFHRVIRDFMIQGGDPNSKRALKGDSALGDGDVGYTVPAEIRHSLFHKKGAVAAARDDNPEKASSGCQFYIVQGRVFPDSLLTQIENTRLKFRLPGDQRNIYETIGGAPWLDQSYTVFGEVIRGMEVVDSIARSKTDTRDRPVQDVMILKARLIKRK